MHKHRNRFALQFKIVLHITYYVYPIGFGIQELHNDHVARIFDRSHECQKGAMWSSYVSWSERAVACFSLAKIERQVCKVLHYGQSEIVTPSNECYQLSGFLLFACVCGTVCTS